MGDFNKIDMITKMFRAMPFNTSSKTAPSKGATVYRIDQVAHADRFRIIYGVEVPRAIEVSRIELTINFPKAMNRLFNDITADVHHTQTNNIYVQPIEDDIEIEASL